MVVNMMADMEVDMVADKKEKSGLHRVKHVGRHGGRHGGAEKRRRKKWPTCTMYMDIDIDITWKSNLVRELVTGVG